MVIVGRWDNIPPEQYAQNQTLDITDNQLLTKYVSGFV